MKKRTILLGVTGSIAAYKTPDLVSAFKKQGWNVHVVLTESASRFVSLFSLEIMSQNKVLMDTFEEPDVDSIYHVNIVKEIDVFLLAPATAHSIAKLSHGIADNMLTNIALVAHQVPRFFAPAMNTNMYTNPLTQSNMKRLEQLGWQKIEPRSTRLACGDEGTGAMAEVSKIVQSVLGKSV